MGKINAVLYNVDQTPEVGSTEQARARNNIGAQAKLVAGSNITIDQSTNTISASVPTPPTYSAGEGLTLTNNTFATDSVNLRPWSYFNHYVQSENWTSREVRGICTVNQDDVNQGCIKIPFDQVNWPFRETSLQYCLCCFYGMSYWKATADPNLAGTTWNGTFGWAKVRTSDRYDYSNNTICDFEWKWNSNGSGTTYVGGWSFILDMNPRGDDAFENITIDLWDHRSQMSVGDELRIGGFIWPMSERELQYEY